MKKLGKIVSIFIGITLFIIAALFSVSLIVQLLNFGADSYEQGALYDFGKMIVSVYGISSVFIPVFFLIAGFACFSEKWNVQKTSCLVVSFIPFLTLSFAENLCRKIFADDYGPIATVKIISILVIAVLLVVAEYLLTVVISSKVANRISSGKKNVEKKEEVSEVRTHNDDNESSEKSYETEEGGEKESDSDDVAEEEDSKAKKSKWSFKSLFSKKNKESEEDEKINDAVDKSINDAVSSDWTLEGLLKENRIKQESVKDEKISDNEKSRTQKKYGDFDTNASLTENATSQKVDYVEEVKESKVEADNEDSLNKNDLPDSSDIMSLDEVESNEDADEASAAEENKEDEDNSELDDADNEINDEENADVATEDLENITDNDPWNVTGVAATSKNEKLSATAATSDEESDPWNVVNNKKSNSQVVYLGKVVKESRKNKKIEEQTSGNSTEIDMTDPAGLVEETKTNGNDEEISSVEEAALDDEVTSMNEAASEDDVSSVDEVTSDEVASLEEIAPVEEIKDDEKETTPVENYQPKIEKSFVLDEVKQYAEKKSIPAEQQLTQNFETLTDSIKTSGQSKTLDEKKTHVNFDKGSGIEEEPKNSKGHALLSSLDSIFSKMDEDAQLDVEMKDASENKPANFRESQNQDNEDLSSDDSDVLQNDEANSESEANSLNKADSLTEEDKNKISKVVDDSNKIVANKNNVPEVRTAVVAPVQSFKKKKHGSYKIPTELLTEYADNPYWVIDEETKQAAENLKATLNEFKIEADVTGIRKGPVVTMFEILPAPGVKLSKIVALQDNIALRLAASSVRIVAPIPGKRAVGIEVPNKDRAIVSFRECIEQDLPAWKKMAVPVVLGKDIQGETQIIDLVKTPHLLIAGSTGSGKSVCVNSMILSILYKRSPNDVKMILIDPKIVELKLYNDIPHLLTPVITEPKRAMQALQYCLCEMERRYALLDGLGVRDISNYNKRIVDRKICTEKLPYIVVIIDEFADLMATTGKELEGVVARLAAMSRAVGIHLVLATQRPSIDVITGLIKANIPSRIAFMVASKTDSRIIIDQVGAEKLLGKGDMLFASATDPFPTRIQGTFVSDNEVEDVVNAVKEWGEPEYIDDEIFVDDDEDDGDSQMSLFSDGEDPLYEKALDIVVQAGKASASYIQRRLKVGYNRAARLVEEMEDRGIVGPANGSKPREIIHMP